MQNHYQVKPSLRTGSEPSSNSDVVRLFESLAIHIEDPKTTRQQNLSKLVDALDAIARVRISRDITFKALLYCVRSHQDSKVTKRHLLGIYQLAQVEPVYLMECQTFGCDFKTMVYRMSTNGLSTQIDPVIWGNLTS